MPESFTNTQRRRVKDPNQKPKFRWLVILLLGLLLSFTAYVALDALWFDDATAAAPGTHAPFGELSELAEKDNFQQAYLKANGGWEHLKTLETLRLNGTLTSPDGDTGVFILKRRPDMVLTTYSFGKEEITYGHADGHYWLRRSQPQSIDTTRKMTKEEAARMESDLLFFDPILSIYLDGEGEVQFIEPSSYDGADVLELTVRLKRFPEPVRLTVDPLTMQIRFQSTERFEGRRERIVFGDYRSVDRVNLAHRMEVEIDGKPEGRFLVNDASFNVGVGSGLFHAEDLSDPASTEN